MADLWNDSAEKLRGWHYDSNYVCILEAGNEDALLDVADLCCYEANRWVLVYEPDFQAHTAIALVKPEGRLRSALAHLPLAGRG